jgi:hypothetical protein
MHRDYKIFGSPRELPIEVPFGGFPLQPLLYFGSESFKLATKAKGNGTGGL